MIIVVFLWIVLGVACISSHYDDLYTYRRVRFVNLTIGDILLYALTLPVFLISYTIVNIIIGFVWVCEIRIFRTPERKE